MASPKINTFREIVPLIYSWRTPDVPKYSGWEKIGYTEQDSADTRIAQQASQMSITKEKLWSRRALYTTEAGGRFTDKDFHAFLKQQGVERETTPEADRVAPFRRLLRASRSSTSTTSRAKTSTNFRRSGEDDYVLRPEQQAAVEQASRPSRPGRPRFSGTRSRGSARR